MKKCIVTGCEVYTWSIYVEYICGVYMWSIYVEYICGVYMWSVYVECICGVYVWSGVCVCVCVCVCVWIVYVEYESKSRESICAPQYIDSWLVVLQDYKRTHPAYAVCSM